MNKLLYQQAPDRLKDLRLSHVETKHIKEGWQQGMYENEICNGEGYGPIIKVYGKTAAEAKKIALIIIEKFKQPTNKATRKATRMKI